MASGVVCFSTWSDAVCKCQQATKFRFLPLVPGASVRKEWSERNARVFLSGPLLSHINFSWLNLEGAGRRVKAQFEANSAEERPEVVDACVQIPFDLDLAVLLAGFAFEAYNTPSEKAGIREVDAAECEVVYTSDPFLREVYQGQLRIKLQGGTDFPALDLWGTSDPYVVFSIGGSIVRSKTCWATLQPVWNEDLSLNVKDIGSQRLSVAAWDANVITAHRRMGNTSVCLATLSGGEKHDLELELEGIGGGGKVSIQLQYKTFEEIEAENRGWGINLLSEFLKSEVLETALKSVFGREGVKARDFVSSAFGLTFPGEQERRMSSAKTSSSLGEDGSANSNSRLLEDDEPGRKGSEPSKALEVDLSNWKLDDKITAFGLQSQAKAEAQYIEKGLVMPSQQQEGDNQNGNTDANLFWSNELKQVSKDTLRQTEQILGSWVMQAWTSRSEPKEQNLTDLEPPKVVCGPEKEQPPSTSERTLFRTAESAMEAWAMLASSLGSQSFVKSEFDKVAFLDNKKTDTQVSIWRDERRRRAIVAFRGTEQTKWRDLQTDLMLVPTGFNPERVGGGSFKDELMVHSGFLTAYDSVCPQLRSILQDIVSKQHSENREQRMKWHVYVTGHSLGGALATLFALDLATSKLTKAGLINITMYNYGSPRVGNRVFAEKYNQFVKDSWRIVNHRDIIPTVPRLMGYCHVAQPIYLAKGASLLASAQTLDLLDDGYSGDLIGEVTPDYIMEEFVKGEQQLLEKLIHTEVAMFQSIRDGSAIMQHMEDFYYIALLELVEKKISTSRIL